MGSHHTKDKGDLGTANAHTTHMKPSDKAEVDILCIYCPDTDCCYYVRPEAHGQSVTLRVHPSRNNQAHGVLAASDFRVVPIRPA
jgi:hypothetical protein